LIEAERIEWISLLPPIFSLFTPLFFEFSQRDLGTSSSAPDTSEHGWNLIEHDVTPGLAFTKGTRLFLSYVPTTPWHLHLLQFNSIHVWSDTPERHSILQPEFIRVGIQARGSMFNCIHYAWRRVSHAKGTGRKFPVKSSFLETHSLN